jgi:hypothetical protein
MDPWLFSVRDRSQPAITRESVIEKIYYENLPCPLFACLTTGK